MVKKQQASPVIDFWLASLLTVSYFLFFILLHKAIDYKLFCQKNETEHVWSNIRHLFYCLKCVGAENNLSDITIEEMHLMLSQIHTGQMVRNSIEEGIIMMIM
jgi:hypothetical protein